MPADFGPTEGRTLPAVTVPGVHVLPADEWLSDDDLAQLTAEELEEARREVVRARLAAVQREWKISRREWLLYIVALVSTVALAAWLPEPWAGYGWHLVLPSWRP
jgi:hypothetical protein